MATHGEIENSARRQPSGEEASEEGGQSEQKKLFNHSTTVSLSSHRSMMARAMMHDALTSSEGVSGFASTNQSNQVEDSVTSDDGVVPLPPDQERRHFDDSCAKRQYDPFFCPLVALELSNLREFINSEQEVLGRERFSSTTEEEDCDTDDTEDSIVVRRRQLSRQ